jgi:hypothetical protein
MRLRKKKRLLLFGGQALGFVLWSTNFTNRRSAQLIDTNSRSAELIFDYADLHGLRIDGCDLFKGVVGQGALKLGDDGVALCIGSCERYLVLVVLF